jgi:DNA-binding XRE family transcriptional regulator
MKRKTARVYAVAGGSALATRLAQWLTINLPSHAANSGDLRQGLSAGYCKCAPRAAQSPHTIHTLAHTPAASVGRLVARQPCYNAAILVQLISAVLKRYRRAAALTQEAFAVRAGYSDSYLGQLERGIRTPAPPIRLTRARRLRDVPGDIQDHVMHEQACLSGAGDATHNPQDDPRNGPTGLCEMGLAR